jgi:hypothetical protein
MSKKKIVITTYNYVCINNHSMTFTQEGDTPEPPFCLSCATLWVGREIVGSKEK